MRRCDVPGCTSAGEFRAPKGRNQLNEYFWFCLDHVREYNRAWNYYAGMSEDEIEADAPGDHLESAELALWHRCQRVRWLARA